MATAIFFFSFLRTPFFLRSLARLGMVAKATTHQICARRPKACVWWWCVRACSSIGHPAVRTRLFKHCVWVSLSDRKVITVDTAKISGLADSHEWRKVFPAPVTYANQRGHYRSAFTSCAVRVPLRTHSGLNGAGVPEKTLKIPKRQNFKNSISDLPLHTHFFTT